CSYGIASKLAPTGRASLLRQRLPGLERPHSTCLFDTGIERFVAQWLLRQFVELGQFAVETVGFRHLQRRAGQAQPDQQPLHARALLGEVFGLLLIARQLQWLGFLAQQAWQPVAQLGGALAIATVVASSGPATLQQPQRGLQREQAPAWPIEFGGEFTGRALADRFVVLAGFDAWAPVLDQRVEQLAQFTAAGARC